MKKGKNILVIVLVSIFIVGLTAYGVYAGINKPGYVVEEMTNEKAEEAEQPIDSELSANEEKVDENIEITEESVSNTSEVTEAIAKEQIQVKTEPVDSVEEKASVQTPVDSKPKEKNNSASHSTQSPQKNESAPAKPQQQQTSKHNAESENKNSDETNSGPETKDGYIYVPGEGYEKIPEGEGNGIVVEEAALGGKDFYEILNDPENEIVGH